MGKLMLGGERRPRGIGEGRRRGGAADRQGSLPTRRKRILSCDRGVSRGETFDNCRQAPDAATLERMKAVVFPASDPVSGPNGPLVKAWR